MGTLDAKQFEFVQLATEYWETANEGFADEDALIDFKALGDKTRRSLEDFLASRKASLCVEDFQITKKVDADRPDDLPWYSIELFGLQVGTLGVNEEEVIPGWHLQGWLFCETPDEFSSEETRLAVSKMPRVLKKKLVWFDETKGQAKSLAANLCLERTNKWFHLECAVVFTG